MVGSNSDLLGVRSSCDPFRSWLLKDHGLDPNDSPRALQLILELEAKNRELQQPRLSRLDTVRLLLNIGDQYPQFEFGRKQKQFILRLARSNKCVSTDILLKMFKGSLERREIALRGLVRDTRIKINQFKANDVLRIKSSRGKGYLLELDFSQF